MDQKKLEMRETLPNGICRCLTITGAWDKRSDNPAKNYGVHGMDLYFEVKRANIGATARFFTNWHLEIVLYWWKSRGISPSSNEGLGSIDYHSPIALYEGQTPTTLCKVTGGNCYGGGSSLAAVDIWRKFKEDPESIWTTLEEHLVETEARVAEQLELTRNFS